MSDASKFIAEVLAGRHDASLKDLADALSERLTTDTIDAKWVCRVGEESFTISDLTYRAIRLFEEATKVNINRVDLVGLSGTNTGWLVAAYWASRDDEREGSMKRAMDRVDELAGDAIRFDIAVEVKPVPFDD